jgi:hypothetical protein
MQQGLFRVSGMVTIITVPSELLAGNQMKNRWVISDEQTWDISRERRSPSLVLAVLAAP